MSGCLVGANDLHGIEVGETSLVADNLCVKNGLASGSDGAGLYASGIDNRLEGNTLHDNDVGLRADAADNAILGNDCQQNSVANFSVVAGSAYGPLQRAATATSAFANFIRSTDDSPASTQVVEHSGRPPLPAFLASCSPDPSGRVALAGSFSRTIRKAGKAGRQEGRKDAVGLRSG